MNRRRALHLFGALGLLGCGRAPAEVPHRGLWLRLDPLVDLVAAAGLEWLIQAHPTTLLRTGALREAVTALDGSTRAQWFADRYGGIRLDEATEVVIAGYPGSLLGLARVRVDEARVEHAFAARADAIEGRAIEGEVVRFWGGVEGEREQVAVFGGEAAGVEHGRLGPLRPAVYFAQGRLKRSPPALRAEPLRSAAECLGKAPLRAFAPGPFGEPWTRGLGGLLAAATAAAAAIDAGPEPTAVFRFVLTGNWGSQAHQAAERLLVRFDLFAKEPLGLLMGFDRPASPPRADADAEALRLEVSFDPLHAARGLHAATAANLAEILAP